MVNHTNFLERNLDDKLIDRLLASCDPRKVVYFCLYGEGFALGFLVIEQVLFHGADIDLPLVENIIADEAVNGCKWRERHGAYESLEIGVEVRVPPVHLEKDRELRCIFPFGCTNVSAEGFYLVLELRWLLEVFPLDKPEIVELPVVHQPECLFILTLGIRLDHDSREKTVFFELELENHMGERVFPVIIELGRADLASAIASERSVCPVLRRSCIELDLPDIGNQGILYRIYDRRFAAPVVSGKERRLSQADKRVMKKMPVDEPHPS